MGGTWFEQVATSYAATNSFYAALAATNSAATSNPTDDTLTATAPSAELFLSAGDIALSILKPHQGEIVTTTITIHNRGSLSSANSGLLITDTFVLSHTVVVSHTFPDALKQIAPQGQATFTYHEPIPGPAGVHFLCVQINPSSNSKSNLSNTVACRAVEVTPGSNTGLAPPKTPPTQTTPLAPVKPKPVQDKKPVPPVTTTISKLPLTFEVNQGQTDASVKFVLHGGAYNLFLTPDKIILDLPQQILTHTAGVTGTKGVQDCLKPLAEHPKTLYLSIPLPVVAASSSRTALSMQLVGANPKAEVSGQKPLPGKTDYFIGKKPQNWHTNISTYGAVQYKAFTQALI